MNNKLSLEERIDNFLKERAKELDITIEELIDILSEKDVHEIYSERNLHDKR